MVLEEATIGGTVYLEYDESEMALPEKERVAFDYRALTNREKIDLLHKSTGEWGIPNGADVCLTAVTRVRNLAGRDGAALDSVAKLLAYHDKDNKIAYMLTLVGAKIWRRQSGDEVGLKN
ncbi:MAG: hypothetical protein WC481_07595 [Candidatus Omnitrophota bacterium]